MVPDFTAGLAGLLSHIGIAPGIHLHASPTCALGFENAEAVIIGAEGRGVAQLFRMIISMRLQTGAQALGLATASYEAARVYAQERRQGGRWDAPAVPIISHPDVQLMLAGMTARIETLRGLIYTAAVAADLSDLEPDASAQARRTRCSPGCFRSLKIAEPKRLSMSRRKRS